MGKKRKQQWRAPQTASLLASLRFRAIERCTGLGHELGYWSAAKRKHHGINAEQAICVNCGEMVFVSPYMEFTPQNPQVPAIKGEALFQLCYKQGTML